MTSRYALVVLAYIIMQTGLALGSSFFLHTTFGIDMESGVNVGLSSLITFSIGLIVILLLLYKDKEMGGGLPGEKTTTLETVSWSIVGVFLVFATQMVAGLIETYVFGIEAGSDNTAVLVEFANQFLPFIFVIAILGPIIEELVFRKAIFGWLYVRSNFFVAGLVSSLIFAVIHFDFEHLLIYAAMGFSFAFLYVKTKRIIVPIISHIALNSFVVIVQVLLYDEIMKMVEPASFIHNLIGLIIQ
ncbi:CAAX amino terminal protease family protein [Bacillus sp. JCM 19046]|nr:CAAX amino terminal protease family protein [Bacillus sp. JCM 19046]